MGFSPVLVLLRKDTYLTQVERSVPDECAIWVGERWDVFGQHVPHFRGPTTTAFVCGKPTVEICNLSQHMGISLVLGIGRPRRLPEDWQHHFSTVDHHHVGGVTRSRTVIVGCRHASLSGHHLPSFSAPAFVARDMSKVLTDMEPPLQSWRSRLHPSRPDPPHVVPVPSPSRLNDGEVMNVGSDKHTIYHGGGWLPKYPSRHTWVQTRSFLLPPSKWGTRQITSAEYLHIYDWSDSYTSIMGSLVDRALFPRVHPCKNLCMGTLRVLDHFRSIFYEGGDGFSSPLPTSGITTGPSSTSSNTLPAPTSGIGSSSGPSPETKDPKNKLEVLTDIERIKRERKATKSDDAAVPIYLWTEHYLEDSSIDWEDRLMAAQRERRLEHAMEVLQEKFFLPIWKKRLTRSFFGWLNKSLPKQPTGARWVEIADDPYVYGHSANELKGRDVKDKEGLLGDEDWHMVEWTLEDQDWCLIKRGAKYRWSRSGLDSYKAWFWQRKDKRREDLGAARDAIERANNSTWWEWSDGSAPFHWRWPKWYRKTIRDGLKIHLSGKKPEYRIAQADVLDPEVKERVKKKLSKVRARRYIAKGYVTSLTSFFHVPKGESDIRMVYDGTKSGLNDAMWVPRFGLPTIETHLRSIEEGTFLADVDVGDCFLNFHLHKSIRTLAGVDVTHYFPNPDGSLVWECWHRALMGVKSSPYQAVQGMVVAEEVIRGSPSDSSNIFRWKRVRMNCPGDPNYDPSKPWVSKVKEDGSIAADLVGYVDDLRPSGNGRKETWRAARRTASLLNYLGLQDAARKRRDSSRTPGAWAGSVILTREDGVYVMADAEKWKKARRQVDEILEMIRKDAQNLDRKRLEEIRGFLIYVVRTYPTLKPYLIGLHLTIDGWRMNRDEGGWKLHRREWEAILRKTDNHEMIDLDPKAPKTVKCSDHLLEHMQALKFLMSAELPMQRRVRSRSGKKVAYCFGDASAAGFGFSLEIDGTVYYEYGQWKSESSNKSSNWRETKNLVAALRRAAKDHELTGLEIFIFTDNTTAESAFWKGYSESKEISSLILQMRKIEMEEDIKLHVVHVSGSRMIAVGVDGLSRADHSNGVMIGEDMKDFIPLHKTAVERSPDLIRRIHSSLSGFNWKFLTPDEC